MYEKQPQFIAFFSMLTFRFGIHAAMCSYNKPHYRNLKYYLWSLRGVICGSSVEKPLFTSTARYLTAKITWPTLYSPSAEKKQIQTVKHNIKHCIDQSQLTTDLLCCSKENTQVHSRQNTSNIIFTAVGEIGSVLHNLCQYDKLIKIHSDQKIFFWIWCVFFVQLLKISLQL